jgi:hypothetical protein
LAQKLGEPLYKHLHPKFICHFLKQMVRLSYNVGWHSKYMANKKMNSILNQGAAGL